MIAGKEPVVVVSSTAVAVIVAAATLFDGPCEALGLMMFVQTNDAKAGIPALSAAEAELKVTVNT